MQARPAAVVQHAHAPAVVAYSQFTVPLSQLKLSLLNSSTGVCQRRPGRGGSDGVTFQGSPVFHVFP